MLVVVESVLGFSEVCGLLDRSHAALTNEAGHRKAEAENPPLEDYPDSSTCSCNRQDSVANDGDQGAVSGAVGRLVGWLRIAAARSNLSGDGSGSSSGITTTTRPVLETARNARTENAALVTSFDLDLNDEDLLLAVAGGQAYDTLYGVSGQCGGGEGWTAFDLEPKESRASGTDADLTAA